MKVVVDVCQNTDLVELLSFLKSREMCVVGFPDNPELEFLRSNEVPIAVSWRTPGKVAKRLVLWGPRKRLHERLKRLHSPSQSTTSASDDEHYFASRSGSPLSSHGENECALKPFKWKKRKQGVNIEDKAMCTKCGTLITSTRLCGLVTHANSHSDFARYKCGACDFQHKSSLKVRAHIEVDHEGDFSIKQHDQMNGTERVRMKQMAHECFPAYISSPNICTNNMSCNTQHASMDTVQEHCKTTVLLEILISTMERGALVGRPSRINVRRGKQQTYVSSPIINLPLLKLDKHCYRYRQVSSFSTASAYGDIMEERKETKELISGEHGESNDLKQSNTSSSEESSCYDPKNAEKTSCDSDCIIID